MKNQVESESGRPKRIRLPITGWALGALGGFCVGILGGAAIGVMAEIMNDNNGKVFEPGQLINHIIYTIEFFTIPLGGLVGGRIQIQYFDLTT